MEYLRKEEDWVFARLTCRCLSPEDSLDISVDKEYPLVNINFYHTDFSFWRRIRDIWKYLTTGRFYVNEFIVREEDYPYISRFFEEAQEKLAKWEMENKSKK